MPLPLISRPPVATHWSSETPRETSSSCVEEETWMQPVHHEMQSVRNKYCHACTKACDALIRFSCSWNSAAQKGRICRPSSHVLSIRDAVLMVSPNRENLGTFEPTSPETQGPVWMPMRTETGCWLCGIRTSRAQRSMSLANANTRRA